LTEAESKRPSSPPTATRQNEAAPEKKKRGFAAMDRATRSRIASKGGRAAHRKGTAREFTSDEARAAGRKRHGHAEDGEPEDEEAFAIPH
jgi:hypothetical protein